MDLNPPEHYAACQNSSCKNAGECLRQLVYRQLTENDKTITVINPLCFPKDDEECESFRTSKKITLAWGIKNILNEIPLKNAKNIKKDLLLYFGKTKYYRFYREEKPILPKEQKAVKNIFVQNGIESEVPYERFTEEYDWRY